MINTAKQSKARKGVGRPALGDLAKARYLVLRLSPAEWDAIKGYYKTSTALREFVLKSIPKGKASSGTTTPHR